MLCRSGVHRFPKYLGDTSELYAPRVTWSKFHTEDPHILGVTVQILVALVHWRRGFVHPWCRISPFKARDCDEVVFEAPFLQLCVFCLLMLANIGILSRPAWVFRVGVWLVADVSEGRAVHIFVVEGGNKGFSETCHQLRVCVMSYLKSPQYKLSQTWKPYIKHGLVFRNPSTIYRSKCFPS